MLERNIHQIWMQGSNKFPKKFQEYSKKTKDMHLKWNYMFWDENDIKNLMNEDEKWKTKYDTFIHLHQKVDFAKLAILYKFGGIVIDTDAYSIKPLDSLFDKYEDAKLIVSLIMRDFLPMGFIQSWMTCNKLSECINNGIYIAKKESDVLSYIINEFINLPSCPSKMDKMRCIHMTTGPGIFDKAVNKYIKENDDNNIVILPYQYLEPCLSTRCFITDETYIVHKHEMSWCSDIVIKLKHIYLFSPQFFNILVFLIFVFIVCVICVFIYKIGKKVSNTLSQQRRSKRRSK